jgi:hypothetical protein
MAPQRYTVINVVISHERQPHGGATLTVWFGSGDMGGGGVAVWFVIYQAGYVIHTQSWAEIGLSELIQSCTRLSLRAKPDTDIPSTTSQPDENDRPLRCDWTITRRSEGMRERNHLCERC